MREIYLWTEWFTDLAGMIASSGERYLIDRAKRVGWKADGTEAALVRYGDENIDPFSFFYALAQRSQDPGSRERVYRSVEMAFEMYPQETDCHLPVRSDYAFMFPMPSYNTPVLFHSRGQGNPQLLWSLFRRSVQGIDSVDAGEFNAALDIGNVSRVKLTQTLFLINPLQFIPCDDKMKRLVALPDNEFNWGRYLEWLQNVRDLFPGCDPYEINLFAFLASTGRLPVHSDRCFHVSTNAYGAREGDFWNAHPNHPELNYEPNNWVFTGGPRGGLGWHEYEEPRHGPPRYPILDASPGDIVLVRTGLHRGRAIGIVYKNDYQDHLGDNSRIHVVWVNKTDVDLAGQTEMVGFNYARAATLNAFRQAPAYLGTFALLDRLSGREEQLMDQFTRVDPDDEKHPHNQILFGPPGTGKTYRTVDRALAIIDFLNIAGAERDIERFHELRDSGQIAMVTFHQNFSYEDFVEGIRPVLGDGTGGLRYELRDGIFKQIAEAARQEGEKRFVLIIDEINRGNIAKIFGELITLIEPSRRLDAEEETKITLTYSQKPFGVPKNLYLIGTMNTADRSIQLLDAALRRRFTFIEMMPDPEHEDISENAEGVNCRKILKAMNGRITALINREHQIGHTYLRNVDTVAELSRVFQDEIFPLLQEYFFEDWSKIRAVLGGNDFVRELDAPRLPDSLEQEDDRKIYERLPSNDERWESPEQYGQIYAGDN